MKLKLDGVVLYLGRLRNIERVRLLDNRSLLPKLLKAKIPVRMIANRLIVQTENRNNNDLPQDLGRPRNEPMPSGDGGLFVLSDFAIVATIQLLDRGDVSVNAAKGNDRKSWRIAPQIEIHEKGGKP